MGIKVAIQEKQEDDPVRDVDAVVRHLAENIMAKLPERFKNGLVRIEVNCETFTMTERREMDSLMVAALRAGGVPLLADGTPVAGNVE